MRHARTQNQYLTHFNKLYSYINYRLHMQRNLERKKKHRDFQSLNISELDYFINEIDINDFFSKCKLQVNGFGISLALD